MQISALTNKRAKLSKFKEPGLVSTREVQISLTNIRNVVLPNCVVCSSTNKKGLHLESVLADEGSIISTFQCDEAFEGYPGVLHGGVVSSILDRSMGNCVFALGQAAVTVEMTTRFRHLIAVDQEATVSARITQSSYSMHLMGAEIFQAGQVKATAKAKFLSQSELPDLLVQRS